MTPTPNAPKILEAIAKLDTFESAQVFAAKLNMKLLFKQWAKLQVCNHCGQKGHARSQCNKNLALTLSNETMLTT